MSVIINEEKNGKFPGEPLVKRLKKAVIYPGITLFVLGWSSVALSFSVNLENAQSLLPQVQKNQTIAARVKLDNFALMKGERLGNLKIDMTGRQVIQSLGTPKNKGQNTLWGADGRYHQNWYYPNQGITIGMVAQTAESSPKIASITLTAPSRLKTKRGLGIGDSYNAVKQAYGKEEDRSSSRPNESFVAGSVYGGLIFSFENGRVSKIFLGAGAE